MIGKTFKSLLAGIVFLAAVAAAAQTWTQLAPTGGPPGMRSNASAVFNTAGDRMIVFGGWDRVFYNDVWVLSHADGKGGTPTWAPLNIVDGPGSGNTGSGALDYGVSGPSGPSIKSDVFGPAGRFAHSAVYDAANNRMMVFGGITGGSCPGGLTVRNDVWVLNHADGTGGAAFWDRPALPDNQPSPRGSHSAVYDPATNSMIVFGGSSGDCSTLNNEVWVLSNAYSLNKSLPVWTQLSPGGAAVPALTRHTAVYDAANNSMIVFGGCTDTASNCTPNNQVWVLADANGVGAGTPTWSLLNTTGTPPTRLDHTAVYDPATNSMMVFGGCAGTGCPANDTWILSNADGTGAGPSVWSQLSVSTSTLIRKLHTAVYNTTNNRMVVFSGNNSNGISNDTWVLSDANGVNFPVAIDIQPGSTANTFGLTHGTVVGVAILSSATFNAPASVDPTSLTFGHVGTEASLITCTAKTLDVNGDGLKDLICYFDVNKAGFQLGDTVGYLKGLTQLGDGIHGSDMVKITP